MSFDYYKSISRKRFLSKKNFSGFSFGFLSFLNLILVVAGSYAFSLNDPKMLGVGQLIIGLGLLFESIVLAKRFAFSEEKSSENLADRFSPEVIELFEEIAKKAAANNVTEINQAYVFEGFSLTQEGKIIFVRLGIPFFPQKNGQGGASLPAFSSELINMFALIPPEKTIELIDIFELICQYSAPVKKYLADLNINEKDISIVCSYVRQKQASKKPKFWQDDEISAGVGEEWSYGYTPTLSQFSHDLSKYFSETRVEINVFGHKNKIDEIETVLAKTSKNNVLLVGEPGVGKKTIVNALAAKVARGNCLPPLKYKHIRQLEVGRILAGASSGEVEARFNGSLDDAVSAGNIILLIDNFQSLLGGGAGQAGTIDASQVLLPYLQNSDLRIIATVTPDEYFQKIRMNPGIMEAFEKIEVSPANAEDTLGIMLEAIDFIESKYRVFVPFNSMKKIVELSDRYIHDLPFPEKALRLLEEVSVNFSTGQIKIIYPQDVEALVSKKADVPVGQVDEAEKDKLLNLEAFLHQRVIGQDEAIKAVSDTLRRARAGISSGKRPVGVFLFLGPTGVGKTETAKALAESYFGSEKRMIRLDMSEYQELNSIDKLIGTVDNPNGVLTNAILENPFSLILLDELEKANKNVLNVFLQVFEDGRLTDPRGRVSDFTNSIIIATSNAGSQMIREMVGQTAPDQMKKQILESLQQQGIFTPEFLNRFDGVIMFNPLTTEQINQVANLMINSINKELEPRKISVSIDQAAMQQLVQMGYDPQYGARPMRRVIQEKVENLLAKKMLSGELKEGQILNITPAELV